MKPSIHELINTALHQSTHKARQLAIKELLLDAFKAGMTEASKLVTDGSFIHELAPDSIMARSISKLILSARDKKEAI